MYTGMEGIGWTVTGPPPKVGGRLMKVVPPVESVVSVTLIGTMLDGKGPVVGGSSMLCTGVMTPPVAGSLALMVTGQEDTTPTVKGGMVMVVVMVTVTPPLPEEYTAVGYGGHDTVIGVGSVNGGNRTSVRRDCHAGRVVQGALCRALAHSKGWYR
jgi:hypothetical protein